MKITLEVVAHINARRHHDRLINDSAFWRFAAAEWYRLYYAYIPFDTNMLANNVDFRPNEIEHKAPYARYQYNGTHFRFRKDKHPKASARWDQAAAPTQLPRLATSLQQYIDSGRLNL